MEEDVSRSKHLCFKTWDLQLVGWNTMLQVCDCGHYTNTNPRRLNYCLKNVFKSSLQYMLSKSTPFFPFYALLTMGSLILLWNRKEIHIYAGSTKEKSCCHLVNTEQKFSSLCFNPQWWNEEVSEKSLRVNGKQEETPVVFRYSVIHVWVLYIEKIK